MAHWCALCAVSVAATPLSMLCARPYECAAACAQMVVFMLLLARLVGWWSALAGVITTVTVMPISAWFGARQSASRERLIALTDARVKLCSEAMSGGHRGLLQHCAPEVLAF